MNDLNVLKSMLSGIKIERNMLIRRTNKTEDDKNDLEIDELQIKALEAAISALSVEGDLISRTEVINAIDEREDVNGNVNAEDIRTDICLIPSKSDKGKWIPVSERLPEKNVWVLVTVEQNGKCFQEIMRRNNYIEAWTDNIDNYTDVIIAWQPLPEPYKENEA